MVCNHVSGSCLVTPRRSTSGPSSDTDSEFPGQHFQGDMLLLALGSSQRDLFEDNWLDVMVRVYWLKARFLALQVKVIFDYIGSFHSAQPYVTCKYAFLVFSQGDMELALESYDVCVGLLQSKPKTPDGKYYTINLPNLRVDAAISVEEVSVLSNKMFFYQYSSHF